MVISNGPNYDKFVVLSNMVGRNIEDVRKFLKENHFNNTTINFVGNNEVERNTVINQNETGEVRRNTAITFNVSLGNPELLGEIDMIELKDKNIADALYFLNSNGIKHTEEYEFSKVKLNNVITQSINSGNKVNPKTDVVKLTVSKGKEIKVIDTTGKTTDDVINWTVANNLKVSFNEKHHVSIEAGKLIGINYKKDDIIAEGTRIIITTSKGPMKVPSMSNINEFRAWADANGIRYSETTEFNDTVPRFGIIDMSVKIGETIDPERQEMSIRVSNGRAVTIPYIVGKNRATIQSQCNSLGLNCSFYYIGYNSAARDTATNQSLNSGAKVIQGSTLQIGLSSGPAQTFNVYIQDSWFGTSYDATVNNLRNRLGSLTPGVTYNFVRKGSNSGFPGQIHPDSPIKGGTSISVTQGRTYTIYIIG